MKHIDQELHEFLIENYKYGDKEYTLKDMHSDYVDKTGDDITRVKFARALRLLFPRAKQKQQRIDGRHTRTLYGLEYIGG